MVPRLLADGFPIPDEMIAPDLDIIETSMVDAWGDLTGDRLTQLGPIPFIAIDRWAARHDIEGDEFTFLLRAVRAADQAYLAWAADELKSRTAHPAPSMQPRANGRP